MSNHTYVDYAQIQAVGSIGAIDTNGEPFEEGQSYILPVVITAEETQVLLSQYDPDSGTSPLVAVARPLARVILDALLRKTQEGS